MNSGVETLKLTSTVIKCLGDTGKDLGSWSRQEWGGEEFNPWSPGGVEAIFTLRNFPPSTFSADSEQEREFCLLSETKAYRRSTHLSSDREAGL